MMLSPDLPAHQGANHTFRHSGRLDNPHTPRRHLNQESTINVH